MSNAFDGFVTLIFLYLCDANERLDLLGAEWGSLCHEELVHPGGLDVTDAHFVNRAERLRIWKPETC